MRLCFLVFLGALLTQSAVCAQSLDPNDWMNDLPTTGRIWSILENQAPWIVTEPLDSAGLQTGTLPYFAALGASWTENQILLNRFNITDPYIPGRPLIDPHLAELTAIEIQTIAKTPAWAGSGSAVELRTVQPFEETAGSAQVFFSGNALQRDSIHSEQLQHVIDASFTAGGRLGGKVPFVAAGFTQDLSKTLDGFSETIDGNAYGVLAQAVPYIQGDTRLEILGALQHLFNSHAGADPLTAPDATTRDTQDSQIVQLRGQKGKLEAGFGIVHAHVSSAFQNNAGDSILDLPERRLSGSAPLSSEGGRSRIEAYANTQKTYNRHNLNFDASYAWNAISNQWAGHTQHIFANGVEEQTLRWNEPADTSVHFQNIGLSAQDVWKPFDRLVMTAGLRFGVAAGGGISWTSLDPEITATIRVAEKGPVLIGSWSRYSHLMQGRYLDFGNTGTPAGGVYSGNTLVSRSGGAYSSIDQHLKQPYTNEIAVGAEQQFSNSWMIGVRFFRRDDHHLIGLQNTGVPFSTYLATTVLDPGNDGIEGTADDAELLLYNRDPTTFGHDFFVLTNPDGLANRCKGLRIYMEKAFANNWEFAASFVAMKSSGTTNPGNSVLQNDAGVIGTLGIDPNTLVLAQSTTYFDRGFIAKLTALHRWSNGFRVGVVARYYDGLPFARMLFVQGFNQGPFFVRATPRDNFPDGFRTEFNATLDVRASRQFGRWTVLADAFNLLDLNRNTRESDLTGPLFSSRIPILTQAPFALRLGLRWRF